MKKLSGTLIVIVILIILVLWGVGRYNGLVTERENVRTAWSNVENQYQRRADLIPNLVNTVKGYAAHEQETFTQVIQARAAATQTKIDASDLSEEAIAQFQQKQNDLSGALGRLMVVVEQYPDLKASQQFLELQSQLEGTENRINVARNTFNETARTYNTKIQKFPTNIIASIFSFKEQAYFKAEGSEVAPKVEF